MKNLQSSLVASALAVSFAIASAMPMNAAPIYVPKSDQVVRTDVEQVNHTRRHWRQMQRRAERRAYRNWRRHAWRHPGYYDDGYYYSYPRRYRRSGVTLEFRF